MRFAVVSIIGLMLIVCPASGTAHQRVYTDICLEPQSGDTAGHIITVMGSASHPAISFTWSEGALMPGLPATSTFSPTSHRLSFTVRSPAGIFSFDGQLERSQIAGLLTEPWEKAPKQITLLKHQLRQPRPACR